LKISRLLLVVVVISLSLVLPRFPTGAAFSPQPGDYFSYSEIQNVGNGTNYGGYSDHTTATGTETMNSVAQNGTVSAHYSYSWSFSNNTGPTQTGSSSGNFTYSSNSFLYTKGNDSQTGYVGPITVWFAIDNTKPVGGTFYLLDTLMTVQSTDYSYHLTSENKNVDSIFASSGPTNYQRRDFYGNFSATYTWNAYFDPSSGYIIGYNYQEQDTNSSLAEGFSYTDQLYVTSTSYALTTAAANSTGLSQYLGYIVILVVVLVIIIIVAVALSRRRRLRQHSPQQFPPPAQYYRPPPGPPPQIDLTPKQPPVEQIVVKEVVKVNCRYCGALMDGTLQTCPFCGAPRT
jgi:hypothetical protein